jgi:hypothetical protein
MTIYLDLLIAIIGALAYLLCANPKWAYLGLVTWGVGLLTFLAGVGHGQIAFLK